MVVGPPQRARLKIADPRKLVAVFPPVEQIAVHCFYHVQPPYEHRNFVKLLHIHNMKVTYISQGFFYKKAYTGSMSYDVGSFVDLSHLNKGGVAIEPTKKSSEYIVGTALRFEAATLRVSRRIPVIAV